MSGEIMDSEQQDKKRMINVEDDRLSSLPDDLIHKILSFVGLKRAIEMSVLSSRWRFIWTSMPDLDFSTEDFSMLPKFSNFVNNVLSRCCNMTEVLSVKLRFCGDVSQEFVKQILNYAFSHNIQQMDVVCLLENDVEFPLSLFSSHSLKHLSLTRDIVFESFESFYVIYDLIATSTLDLPALTTLYLADLTLSCDDNTEKCIELFSKCANLKNLTLASIIMKGLDGLRICNPLLSNLTITYVHGSLNYVIVITPQLKNLTIRNWWTLRYLISAPDLESFVYDGSYPLRLSIDGFRSLEKLDLCVSGGTVGNVADAHKIVSLFQKLRSVKFLRLNLEIVEFLSSSPELISNQPSPFANLKSLKIYPVSELTVYGALKKLTFSTEVKNYLLDSSPNATFTLISREEIRDMKNTELAQKLMADFHLLLEREKVKLETNKAHMEQGKTKQLQIEEKVKHVNRCWNDFSVQIEQGKEKTGEIISELKDIRRLLKKLPTSKRADLQPFFSSLCAEADIVVNDILDNMKIQCDMKGSRFSVYFREFASTSESSS